MMKGYFLTGLALLLPFVVTLWLTLFLINFLTDPFLNLTISMLSALKLLNVAAPIPNYLTLLVKLFILILLVFATFIVGSLAHHYLGRKLFNLYDQLMHQIPLLNKIYKASKEVTHSILDSESRSFSEVVLVPFPHSKALAIGFITCERKIATSDGRIAVLLPATPNPTQGFMLLFPPEEVIVLNLKVDQALKFIMSCGVMAPSSK